jgi:hypothetical protein
MKLRLLFSLLFVIATTLTAVHQLEHISGEHNSNSCSVCIVDHHSVSGDIIAEFHEQPALYLFHAITLQSQTFATFTKKTSNHANAPPLIS